MNNNKLLKILNSSTENVFYIIGETAYNHEGNLKYLSKTIDELAGLKIDAVKFHLLLNPESYMQKNHPLIKQVKKWIFSERDWLKLINYSRQKGLEVIALCDDIESIEFILKNKMQIAGIELHASSLNDYFMMERLLDYEGVIILGIGGSTIEEIEYVVDFFKQKGKKNILLIYGFQAYPTNYAGINLKKLLKIKEMFNIEVGYADHTAFNDEFNELVSVLGCALGAKVLEKHYTPTEGLERVDYHSAIGRDKILKLKNYLEVIKKTLGGGELTMSEEEKNYGKIGPMKKAVVARKKIGKGKKLQLKDLWYKRTAEETYVKQNQIWNLIGGEALKDIGEDEIIDFSKVKYIPRKKETAKQFLHLRKKI